MGHLSNREVESCWDRMGSRSDGSESEGGARDFDLRERLERLREPDSLADLKIRSMNFQMVLEGWFRSPLRFDLWMLRKNWNWSRRRSSDPSFHHDPNRSLASRCEKPRNGELYCAGRPLNSFGVCGGPAIRPKAHTAPWDTAQVGFHKRVRNIRSANQFFRVNYANSNLNHHLDEKN